MTTQCPQRRRGGSFPKATDVFPRKREDLLLVPAATCESHLPEEKTPSGLLLPVPCKASVVVTLRLNHLPLPCLPTLLPIRLHPALRQLPGPSAGRTSPPPASRPLSGTHKPQAGCVLGKALEQTGLPPAPQGHFFLQNNAAKKGTHFQLCG